MKSRLMTLLTVAALSFAACSNGAGPPSAPISVDPGATTAVSEAPPAAAIDITIFGAASLKGALDKTKTAYAVGHADTTMTISTDSSSALETQIEQGAPADVFLSADTANLKKLVDKGLASGRAVTFAGNALTIIVPTANPAGISTPADLAQRGLMIIAAGDAVPITRYATQLITNLAKMPGYPTDFAAKYAANIASKEDNVKAVVAKIELGEGDAGIVYLTDATASNKVTMIGDIPAAANIPAMYAGVVVKASTHQAAAQSFLTWFAGPDGQAILASFGFLPPS